MSGHMTSLLPRSARGASVVSYSIFPLFTYRICYWEGLAYFSYTSKKYKGIKAKLSIVLKRMFNLMSVQIPKEIS